MLSFCYCPNEDQEQDTLSLMLILTKLPFSLKDMLKSDRLADYICREYSRNKDIFDLKKDLLE